MIFECELSGKLWQGGGRKISGRHSLCDGPPGQIFTPAKLKNSSAQKKRKISAQNISARNDTNGAVSLAVAEFFTAQNFAQLDPERSAFLRKAKCNSRSENLSVSHGAVGVGEGFQCGFHQQKFPLET